MKKENKILTVFKKIRTLYLHSLQKHDFLRWNIENLPLDLVISSVKIILSYLAWQKMDSIKQTFFIGSNLAA